MTIDLDELGRKAKAALEETDDRPPHDWDALSPKADKTATLHSDLTPAVVLAMIERVRGLERVARTVRAITADLAKNGFGADCPYVSQEEAVELLAIIDDRVNGV